jgi:menaquinone-dependent protoporphyrinogen oxidase
VTSTSAGSSPRPRVLVAFAGRHGATREMAAALARGLADGDRIAAVLAPVERQPDAVAFDAVVLGSGVYDGRWLDPALRWVCAMADELRERPVWLFSGVVAVPVHTSTAGTGEWVADVLGAREHRFFGGRVEHRLLSAAERSVWPCNRRLSGDFRDWPALDDWCAQIVSAVTERPVPRL